MNRATGVALTVGKHTSCCVKQTTATAALLKPTTRTDRSDRPMNAVLSTCPCAMHFHWWGVNRYFESNNVLDHMSMAVCQTSSVQGGNPMHAKPRTECCCVSFVCGHAGATGAAYIALTGDLPGAVLAFKANYPLLVFPAKFLVAYPLVYHYLGGMRHFVWDLHKIGNQADHTSLLETERVETSSKILLASSVVLTGVAALL